MIEPLETRIAPATFISAFQLSNATGTPSVMAVDSQNNLIIAGRLFDTSVGADPAGDVYIEKWAPDNTLLWQVKWGGAGVETPTSVAVTAADNILVTGGFSSTNANFNNAPGGISAQGLEDAFLIKINADRTVPSGFGSNGQLRWGGTGTTPGLPERGLSVTVDHNGAVLVGGVFSSPNAGFGGFTSFIAQGPTDGFVFRVNGTTGVPDNAFGTGGMSNTIPLPGSDSVTRVAVDSSNNVYLAFLENTSGAGSEADVVLKLRAADGQPETTFGLGGLGTASPFATHPSTPGVTTFDFVIDSQDRIVGAGATGQANEMEVFRLSSTTGNPDPAFNAGVNYTLAFDPKSPVRVNVDSQGHIFVTGNNAATGKTYVAEIGANSNRLNSTPVLTSATTFLDAAIDHQDRLILRGTNAASADIDPTNSVFKLPAPGTLPAGMTEGHVVRIDPHGIDAKNPLRMDDFLGADVLATLSGPGSAHYTFRGDGVGGVDLSTIELFNTDLTTRFSITGPQAPDPFIGGVPQLVQIDRIFTHDPLQNVGSIFLVSTTVFGSGVNNAESDLHVSGKLNTLVLGDVSPNTIIQLGDGLPYNILDDTTTPDTYNNHPDLTLGKVLGVGVQINVTGNGQPQGPGGGGLGKVTIGSWNFTGFIRTTQSVGDITVLRDDFRAVLEIDKLRVGEMTTANTGAIYIKGGAWGGSGSEVEGNVESFDAVAFLAGATLTAASLGPVNLRGNFDGAITLTDPDSPALPTFSVRTDYTGVVTSALPIKKLNIKGDFVGSLKAPLIGSITAFSFLGTAGNMGVPVTFIEATQGGLGTLTSVAGPIRDYTITTDQVFKGMKVTLTNLLADSIGIDNVHITAASIGNIAVSLRAAAAATGLDLVGISDSAFVTTNEGTTKTTAGSIGTVTVTITGNAHGNSAYGILHSTFDALAGTISAPTSTINTQGNLSIKLTGHGGANVGMKDVTFAANTIGTTTVTVNRSTTGGATARGIDTATFTATGAIGAINVSGDATSALVTDFDVWAGGNVGAVTVKSKDFVNGTLIHSAILAGQMLTLNGANTAEQMAKLALAKLGNVTLSGSLIDTDLVAGATIGTVSVGKDMTDALVLAGAKLGGDFAIGGNETYQRAATIGAITVKGSFTLSSIVAGVNPGGDAIFGNANDTAAAAVNFVAKTSTIGAISLSTGTAQAAAASHQHAIEAAALAGLKLAGKAVTGFPLYLDQGTAGEDAGDVVVRLI